jgi:hypothetical protein
MAAATERPWLPHARVDLPTVLIASLFLGVCALWPRLVQPVQHTEARAGMVLLVDAAQVQVPDYRRPDLFALPSGVSFGQRVLAADALDAPLDLARPSLALDTVAVPARQSAFVFQGSDGLGASEVMAAYASVWSSPAMVRRGATPKGAFAVAGLAPAEAAALVARCFEMVGLGSATEPWRVRLNVMVAEGFVQQVFIEEGSTEPLRDRLLATQLMGMPLASPRDGGSMVVISFSGALTATPASPVASTEE